MSAGRVGCDDMEALGPELALGTLTGAERADAVGHLASCAGCQQRVSELARVVDSMLLLAPEDDPTPELEARVLARTVGDRVGLANGGRRISRRGVVLAGCLTAVASLVVGFGVALLIDGDGNRSPAVRTAVAVEDGGRSICRAVINGADPAWLFVSLDEPGEARADYIVELELARGGPVRVGRIELRDGHGVLAVTIELDDDEARAVRLVGADEELGYEASFS